MEGQYTDITPLTEDGGFKEEIGARAEITIVYNYDSLNDLIDIKRVYGDWTPDSSLYYITDREVIYRADSMFTGYVEKKNPSSNSFNYYPDWGYVPYYPNTAYSLTGAFSWAKIRVYDMTAYYDIHVAVKVQR